MPTRRIVWGGSISGEAAGQEEPYRHNGSVAIFSGSP
jgi:hypothetical protein